MAAHSSFRRSLNRFIERPFVLSGVLCAAGIAAIAVAYGIVFDTIDDYNVMLTVSGDKTGEPYFQLTFFNSVYAFLISLLYRLTDAVQWYSVIQLFLIWISLTVVFGCVLARSSAGGKVRAGAIPVLAVIAFACFAYPVQRMQFTTTASLLGAAACALVFLVDPATDERAVARKRIALSGVFLAMAVLERYTAGLCCVAFWVAGVVRLLLFAGEHPSELHFGRLVRQVCATATACFLVVSLFVGGDALVKKLGDNSDYMEYNQWRIEFQDHPHPSFDEAQELYESVGWSREVYNLTTYLIYMDPAINEDALRTIALSPQTAAVQPGIRSSLSTAVSLFRTNQSALALGLVVFAACTGLLALVLRNRGGSRYRSRWIVLGAIGLLVLSGCLALYLCLSGRWMLRLLQTICFPLIACLLMLVCDASRMGSSCRGEGRASGAHLRHSVERGTLGAFGLSCAFVLVLCPLGAAVYLTGSNLHSLQERDETSKAQMQAVESYARSNADKVLVHDMSFTSSKNSYDPFRPVDDEKLRNLIMLGGSYVGTGSFNRQLALNGLDDLDAAALLDDDVYYISDTSKGFMDATVAYMDSLGIAYKCNQVEDLGNGVGVFKFSPVVTDDPLAASLIELGEPLLDPDELLNWNES